MNQNRFYTTSIFWFAVLFILHFNSIFSQTTFSSEDELKKEANRLYEEKEFAKAYPLFSQLLSVYSKDPQYNYKFGACLLYSSNDKEKAIPYLEYAAKRQQSGADKEVFFYLGRAYHLNYRFSDAIKQYGIYKTLVSAKGAEKYDVDRQIEMCENGKKLLRNISDLSVLEKKEVQEKDFFRSYNLSEFNAKIILTPEELKTSTDKKKKEDNIMYLAPNRKELYFSSHGDDGKTGKDIYMTKRTTGGDLSKPVKLSEVINTRFDEDYAFLHPNGKTLYFCSKGHNSMGGYDIFKSEWDASTQTWGKPQNMDFAINTPDDDILFVSDEENKTAYFSSRRESAMGNISVYKIKLDRKPLEVAIIVGSLIKETGDKIPSAKITITKTTSEEVIGVFNTNSSDGTYLLRLPNGGKFSFTIESDGFTKSSQIITIPTQQEIKPLSQKITLKNDGTSDKLIIANDFDKAIDSTDQSLTAQYIKEKAALEVSPAEEEIKASAEEETNTVNNNNNTSYEKQVVNPTKQVSNSDIINIAYDDAKQTQKDANELRKNSDAAEVFSNQKNELAVQKKEESQTIIKNAENITNQSEKMAQLDRAAILKKQADTLANESALALTISKQLDGQAKKLQQQADEELKYAKDLENTIKTGANEKKMNSLLTQKEKLDKQSDSIKTASRVTTELNAKAEEKQLDANKYMAKYLDAQQDLEDMQSESKRLKAEAEKTKSSATKETLTQQAADIDNEINAKKRESESYNQQAKTLQFQADSLKNSVTLSNAMMTEIQSDPTSVSSSTSATQNSNAITGKSNETANNTKPLNIQSRYVDVFVVQMRQAEKISDELERETQLSIIYQQWTDSLDQQIKVLRELLAVNKIEEEQKEIKYKISELTSSVEDKRQRAAESRSKVDTLKLNATLASIPTTTVQGTPTNTTTTTTPPLETNTTTQTNTQVENIETGFSGKLKEIESEPNQYVKKSKEQEVYTAWSYSLHNEAVRLRESGQTEKADELEKLSKEKETTALQAANEALQIKNTNPELAQDKDPSVINTEIDKNSTNTTLSQQTNTNEPEVKPITSKQIDSLPIQPLLPTTPPESIKNKDAYKQYVALKNESDWSKKYAAKQMQMANDLQKISDEQYKESEKLANKGSATTDPAERQKLMQRADDLERNSLKNQARSDSLKVIAVNYQEEANTRLTESELFLQSIDKESYEEITASVKTSESKAAVEDSLLAIKNANTAITEPLETEIKSDAEPETLTNITTESKEEAADTKTNSSSSSENIKPVSSEILSKYYNKTIDKIETTGTTYSRSRPIPLDPPMPEGLIFKIQIGAFRNAIPQDLFRGLKPISAETTPRGFLRYTVGLFQSFTMAMKAKKQVNQLGYRDAFIVAFYNGKRISLGEGFIKAKNLGEKIDFADLNEIKIVGNSQEPYGLDKNNSALPTVKTIDVHSISGMFYTIQIGVFSKPTTSVQLYNINPLNSEKTVDGFIRYTTGKFTDEKAAIKAKNNIVSKGIKDAFVVAYYNGKRISINQAKGLVSAEGEQIITKGKQESPVFNSNTSSTTSSASSENIVFKVQIGAYKEKVPIEEANRLLRFANSGIKTFTDESGLMIYTVGEFIDYQEANSLKTQLISQGLTDAFVIGMKNGKKISASEMLQFAK